MNPRPLHDWIPNLEHPLVIAGPCSADSEDLMVQTANELVKDCRVRIFRAGIWKPRTRPGIFDGHGERALPWMNTVKKESGLLTATEVANARHVELALKHNIDILWIGARTSANPFSVQEIAQALKGTDSAVMIKNPINCDLELWMGAIERVANAGINKIIAIHRGFSTYTKGNYRNPPLWQIPIELKHRCPSLPIICDPSHICGSTQLIGEVSQMAMDLNNDGLMIETHIDPSLALSDSQQHLSTRELTTLLDQLVLRSSSSSHREFEIELEGLRGQIDRVDKDLLNSLQMRMEIVQKIAKAKIKNGVTALQLNRMEEMMRSRQEIASKLDLPSTLSEHLFKLIHSESVKIQTEIMKEYRKQ